MKKNVLLLIVFAVMAIGSVVAQVQMGVPATLNLQGLLVDSENKPVNATINVTVDIYSDTTAAAIYTEDITNVTVDSGYYNIRVGTNSATSIIFKADRHLWYELTIGGVSQGKVEFDAVPFSLGSKYAEEAKFADSARVATPIGPAGGILTGTYPMPDIDQGKLGEAIEKALTGIDLYAKPIGPAGGDLTGFYPDPVIADRRIKSKHIDFGAVGADQIANGALTLSKLGAPSDILTAQFMIWDPATLRWEGLAASELSNQAAIDAALGLANDSTNRAKISANEYTDAALGLANAALKDSLADSITTVREDMLVEDTYIPYAVTATVDETTTTTYQNSPITVTTFTASTGENKRVNVGNATEYTELILHGGLTVPTSGGTATKYPIVIGKNSIDQTETGNINIFFTESSPALGEGLYVTTTNSSLEAATGIMVDFGGELENPIFTNDNNQVMAAYFYNKSMIVPTVQIANYSENPEAMSLEVYGITKLSAIKAEVAEDEVSTGTLTLDPNGTMFATTIYKVNGNITLEENIAMHGRIIYIVNTSASLVTVTTGAATVTIAAGRMATFVNVDGTWYGN